MMKKTMLVFAALAASVAAFAQTTPGQQTPPTAEQRITRRVEYLTALLTLLPSQVTQITQILTDEQKAAATIETSLDAAHTALEDAVTALAVDTTLARLATQLGVLQGPLAGNHAKYEVKFQNVLTKDQREKLAKLDGPGDRRPGDRGPGGPGPGGPGRGPGR